MLRIILALFCTLCVFAWNSTAEPAKSERRVVIVVWDGMRPDFVSEENTPTLWKLAKEGVIFRNHHPVYPSATNVNGTAMVTGVYPGKNDVIANICIARTSTANDLFVETPAVVRQEMNYPAENTWSPTIAELLNAQEDAR
jgi:predicted AlkP superfamily pyrophosphatase or phosphodiesterase